jgi:hypothetical protein
MSGKCKECSNYKSKLRTFIDSNHLNRQVSFVRWETQGIPRKVSSQITLEELLLKFDEKFMPFKLHSYIANVQSKELRLFQENIKVDNFLKLSS